MNNLTILEAATKYLESGFSVVPITKGSKKADDTWKVYQERRATPEERDSWFSNGSNNQLAIVCGKISGGLLVFDFDGSDWEKHLGDFIERYQEFGSTRTVITGSGKIHLYSYCQDLQDSVTKVVRDFENGSHIELRANRHYVLAPPSLHPSGGTYSFENEQTPIITITPERLEEIIAWLKEGKKQKSLSPENSKPSNITLTLHQKRALARYYTNRLTKQCKGGANRNDKGFELGMYLNDLGLEWHEAIIYLIRFKREVPQWSDKDEYTMEEATESLRSAFKNERGTPWIPDWFFVGEDVTEEEENKLIGFNLSDIGNANSFLLIYGNQYHYVREKDSWFKWGGVRWEEDNEVCRRDFVTMLGHKNRLAYMSDESEERKIAIQKWTIHSQSSHSITAALNEARSSQEGIACSLNDFDSNDWLLCCENGVVDLKTGQFREATSEDKLHKSTGVYFDPDAKCPRWLQFLDEIFEGNSELIAWIKKAVGYSLTGSVIEHILIMLHGVGSNGKTVLLGTLGTLLGEYGQTTPSSTFKDMEMRGTASPEIARTAGIRMVKSIEVKEHVKLDNERIKSLTGGDKIAARFLYNDIIEFYPKFKIWWSVNHKPIITDTTWAMWRRVKLIPFNKIFSGIEIDQHLEETLKGEMSGILNWAIEGCQGWRKEGLGDVPEIVKEATNEYRMESDVVGRFLEEKTIQDKTNISTSTLFEHYKEWCKKENEEPFAQREFTREVKSKGFKTTKKVFMYFVGLALKK